MNKGGILYVISIFVIISCTSLHAQDPVVEPHDSITTPPSSLIFIPADWDKVGPNAIETEIADLFIDAAINLDIIEVVDWLYADDVIYDESIDIENQIDPPLALFIGEIGRIDHVYLFKINSFIQEGREDIPDDRSFTDKLSAFFINMLDDKKTTSSESYPKNIHTEIEIELDLIDVRKAEIIRNFLIQAQYTGGRKYYSRTKLMDIIYHRIQDELKRQYLSSFSIYNLETNIKLLREPGEQILERGDMLELYEPDQIDYLDGAEIRTPGKPVAYCQVQEKTLKYYRTTLLRQWEAIDTSYVAREFKKQLYGFALEIPAPVKNKYYSFNMRFFYSPIQKWDWGGVFRIQRVEDSWNELNWGVGFGAFVSYKLFNISRFALKSRLDADLDVFFKNDDYDESATLALGSFAPGLSAEFVFSKNTDIYFQTGYRFFGNSDNWEINMDDDEPEYDAYWIDSAPKMDISGIYVNVGFRFLYK